MLVKKQVKSRLLFQKGIFTQDYLDVTSTFNMTERAYLDRDPDMLVEDADGVKYRIVKATIIAIREVAVVEHEVKVVDAQTN